MGAKTGISWTDATFQSLVGLYQSEPGLRSLLRGGHRPTVRDAVGARAKAPLLRRDALGRATAMEPEGDKGRACPPRVLCVDG